MPVTNWTGPLPERTYLISIEPLVVDGSGDRFQFVQWEDGSTNPTRTINLTTDMTISVTYEKVVVTQHVLTIAANIGGTTNPAPGDYVYDEGTVVTVSAVPDTGLKFDSWDLNGISAMENPITITMDNSYTLTASFTAIPPAESVIQGVVTDVQGDGVEGVSVDADMLFSTTTGADGSYFLTVPVGQYSLIFSKVGFKTETVEVDVSTSGTYVINVSLAVALPGAGFWAWWASLPWWQKALIITSGTGGVVGAVLVAKSKG